MFEKEAEEYSLKYCNGLVDSNDIEMLEVAYQDGAEFGYNKAKEEYEKRINVLTQNRDELLSEIEKLEERIGELEECY